MVPLPEPLRSHLEFLTGDLDESVLDVLRVCDAARAGLRHYEHRLVDTAKRRGATWADIGDAVGIHRQNAHRRFR